MVEKLRLSEDQWRQRLSAEEYRILREHGTERPGSGCFLGTKTPGTYVCAGCHQPLFKSGEKFESGTGWPSFTQPLAPDAVTEYTDRSHGMIRGTILTLVPCCCGRATRVFTRMAPEADRVPVGGPATA